MNAVEFVKAKKKEVMEKKVINSMQNKDFARAIYFDKQLKELIKNDKNLNESFKSIF